MRWNWKVLSTWRRRGKAAAGAAVTQYTSAHEGNTSRIAPGEEGAITSSAVLTGRETMTAELEVVVDRSVGGEELLRMPG